MKQDKIEETSKIFEFLPNFIEKFFNIIAIACIIILIVPTKLLYYFDLINFKKQHKALLSIITILFISKIISTFINIARFKYGYLKILKTLDKPKRRIIKAIYESDEKEIDLSLLSSNVVLLKQKGVICPASAGQSFALSFTLHLWVEEYLNKNADKYFKDLT